MELRVLGAGLGRTGTLSLKLALERLLGEPCYHMVELFSHPGHVALWHGAARGEMPDWRELFRDYGAAVDFPVAVFWPELSDSFPEALVVLSLRDPESWWRSASSTIFPDVLRAEGPWRQMINEVFESRFTLSLEDKSACIAAYERHVETVQRTLPRSRLLEWQVSEGWAPLCSALGVPVPEEPFPHANTTEEFRRAQRKRSTGARP